MAFSKLPSLQFFRGFDPRSHHHLSSPPLLSIKAFVSVSPSQLCLFYHRSSLKSLLDNRLPPDVGYSISACLNSFLMSVCVALRHKSSSASLCIFRESKYQTPSLRPHSQDTTLSAFMCLLDLLPGLFTGCGWKETTAVLALWRFVLLIKLPSCVDELHIASFSTSL